MKKLIIILLIILALGLWFYPEITKEFVTDKGGDLADTTGAFISNSSAREKVQDKGTEFIGESLDKLG